jgi:hypothetical protein
MPAQFLSSLRPIRFYALLLLLPLGWFAWGSLTGTRLLGDDNESTETLRDSRGGSSGSGGRARFYHK